ncbi:MAG: PKD domain-containing protein, partial [Thermoanaerobaculia bacterium]|nr:PKD domain-containing protein [Thermoanaerobaculia bacterium]
AGWNARLYKITGGGSGLQEVTELENYVSKFYSTGAGGGQYVNPPYALLYDAVVHRSEKTKKYYLIVGNFGLGDVYELRAGESIKATVKSTQRFVNPNSLALPNSGPYYGDEVTFTSQTSNAQPPVRWTFGDGGFADATVSNPDVKYQFGGVPAAQLPVSRQVVATSQLDVSLIDTLNVTLKKPEVRVALKGTAFLFKQPDASSPVPIVSTDQFLDASDGSIEGHYSEWKRSSDSASTLLNPDQEFPVGGCGERTLYFTGQYGPYNATTSITPIGTPASFGINGVAYTVRAISAGVSAPVADATNVIFSSATRLSTSSVDNPGGALTPVEYTWQLLRSDLSVVTSTTGTIAVGQVPAFVIPKSTFQGATNWRVRLSLNVVGGVSAPCGLYRATKADSGLLSGPQLNGIVATGCANVGGGCSMTASVPAGADTTGWSYTWTTTGPGLVASGNATTYAPSFTVAGSYTTTLTVSNAIGTATISKPISIAAPLCASAPANNNMGLGYQGNGTSRCSNGSSTACAPGEGVTFTMSPFGWVSGSCDVFAWNFGDGGTSAEKSPTHSFSSPGQYTVTLTVTGGLSTGVVSKVVTVGGTTPPPPPPGCGMMYAEQNVYIAYQGTAGCVPGAECKTNDNIGFYVQGYNYNTACGPHTYQWNFSDGGTSNSSTVAHPFTTAGTHTLTLQLNNGVNGVTLNKAVKVVTGGGGACPSMVAGNTVYIGYTGAESNCTASSGGCKVAENINFTGSSFGYNYACSAHTFAWTFGDGGSSTAQNPSHIFNNQGTYNVKLTIKNSQQEVTMEKLVSVGGGNPVEPTVTVDFSSEKQSDPKLVKFTPVADPASAVKEYQWTFGDGGTATGLGAQFHMYSTTGSFSVTVTAKSASGATQATKTKQVEISTVPSGTTRRRGARH